ncbi:MAG: carbohydrate ABC transporter permease, partial [Symbiobacteriaceae bacterium]|nr:carbohydrate ABC transporter permease [Symbiobacteriaceae bacterium]
MKNKVMNNLGVTLRYAILSVFALITLFPFYWMFVTALADANRVIRWPPALWPQSWNWQNFRTVLSMAPFDLYFRNTLWVVLLDLT